MEYAITQPMWEDAAVRAMLVDGAAARQPDIRREAMNALSQLASHVAIRQAVWEDVAVRAAIEIGAADEDPCVREDALKALDDLMSVREAEATQHANALLAEVEAEERAKGKKGKKKKKKKKKKGAAGPSQEGTEAP